MWGRILRAWKVSRTAALTGSIFSFGYATGQVDFARDPEVYLAKTRRQLLSAAGAATELPVTSFEHQFVENVGKKVISAALSHAKAKLIEVESSTTADYDRFAPPGAGKGSVDQATEIAFWRRAIKLLSGRWTFIVGDSPTCNAFVSDMAPRNCFVLRGLLTELKLTPEELALCLAHELSHSILGHSSEKAVAEAFMAGVHLTFLVAFPEGFTFFNDLIMSLLRGQLSNTLSRSCEMEADELGAVIAARACFDPVRGAGLFKKLGSVAGVEMLKQDR